MFNYIVGLYNFLEFYYYMLFYRYIYKLDILNGNVSVGLGIKYYANKFKKNNKYDTLVGSLAKKDEEEETKLVNHYLLSYGNTYIDYEGNKILIVIKKTGLPTDEFAYNYVQPNAITIYLLKKKSSNDNKIIINNFLKKCISYYEEYILDKDTNSDLIKTYIYDEYWDTLNKRAPRNINTIHLPKENKDILKYIKTFKNKVTKEKYKEKGIPYKINILLEGMPGTGKSSLIFAVASELNMNLAYINFNSKLDDNSFMQAIRKIPKNCILVLEDIDALFKARKENDEYKNVITFSALLNTLDGPGYKFGLITFLTTNYECNLDSALKRPGRIDKILTFTYCTNKQVESMFNIFYPDKKDEFKKFYKLIKNLKFTTAILQQYFIWHMDNYENIYLEENIEEFKKSCLKHDFNKKLELYS